VLVLVMNSGEVGIDNEPGVTTSDNMVGSSVNGCICVTSGEWQEAVQRVLERSDPPDFIVVGDHRLADPLPVVAPHSIGW